MEFNSIRDENIKNKYGLPDKFIVCPGALTYLKGLQNVVEASKYYSDIAYIVFIGDRDLRNELESKIEKRGMFLGYVSS